MHDTLGVVSVIPSPFVNVKSETQRFQRKILMCGSITNVKLERMQGLRDDEFIVRDVVSGYPVVEVFNNILLWDDVK